MKTILYFILYFTFSVHAIAQQKVEGKVLAESDIIPLEGAIVSLKGTATSVTTDALGQFSLSAAGDSAILIVSFVGYKTEIVSLVLPHKGLLKIMLEESAQQLTGIEIVSTGFQKLPKERATGSFSTVSRELFNQQIGTDILSRLPAIANSVVMNNGTGNTPQLMVRGLSTISGPKAPLIVIDNFPYDGDIGNINPNIVESITILRDAAASSIWGARASNGVIVITTKSGRFSQPLSVDFNAALMLGNTPNLSYIPQMASSDFIDMETELFKRGFYDSQINSVARPVISPVVDLLHNQRIGLLTEDQVKQQIDKLKSLDARDQFRQYMYKLAVKQQYFLNVQGGSKDYSWTSVAGYDHNTGNLGETYERLNLRFQNTYRYTERFSLSTGLYYTQTKNQSGRYGYNDVSMKANSFVPYMLMADSKGNALSVAQLWNKSFVDTVGAGKLLNWEYFPLTNWKHHQSENALSDILMTASMHYQLIKGLNTSVSYQYEKQLGSSTVLADENSFESRDYINRFTQINNDNLVYVLPYGGILDKSENQLVSNNLRGQMNYEQLFGKHHISVLIGAETRISKNQSHQERFYGYNPDNLTTGNPDYSKPYPSLINGENMFIYNGQFLRHTNTRFLSQFANGAYTYADRYVLSGSIRRDGSNLFGLNTNDQWNPFWSVGFKWNASNEKFYMSDFLPYLSIRGTYGFSGNINPAMVAVNTMRFLSNSTFTNTPAARFNNYYNPQLKWETSGMFNLALDFRTSNNRISGAIEHYRKEGKNLFGRSSIDYTSGVDPSMLLNVASMTGRGWDIQFNSLNIKRALQWRTILNFSINRDEVKEYLLSNTLASQYISSSGVPISGISGNPVYSIYAYKWAGLDPQTGEAQGYLDGEVSKNYSRINGLGTSIEELDFFGSAIPTRFGSVINSLSYKNFTLNTGISFKLGYWFRNNSIHYTGLFNDWRMHSDYALRWQRPGDELITNVPVNLYTSDSQRDAFYSGSSILVEKADHIRLQYISVKYEFTTSKRTNVVQVQLNVSNLGLLWKANKRGVDPDYTMGEGRTVSPMSYALGLHVKL